VEMFATIANIGGRDGRDGSGYGAPGPSHQQQPNNLNSSRPFAMDEEEFWKEKQMQQKNVEIKAAMRAKEMRYIFYFGFNYFGLKF